jgi:hypothetical protein
MTALMCNCVEVVPMRLSAQSPMGYKTFMVSLDEEASR